MIDFSKEIDAFQKYGTYDYKFDEGGNLVFKKNPTKFTEKYLSIPLTNYVYNGQKISSFYNTEFLEFVPTIGPTTSVIKYQESSELELENKELKERLTLLTEKADENITESERLAIKQIILELRISLKQGEAERDFSTTFPYLPITK